VKKSAKNASFFLRVILLKTFSRNHSVMHPRSKILIDARMVEAVPHGIARYVTQIAWGLEQVRHSSPLPYDPVFLVNHEVEKTLPFALFQTQVSDVPFLNPKEIFKIPVLLKNLGAAAYHSPSFSSLWASPCPTLVTIHDLNHLTYGSLSKKIYYQVLLKRFALNSQTVMTVSEFSRQEISKWLKVEPESIEVIHNALTPEDFKIPEPSFSKAFLEKLGLTPHEYFFCLSNPKPHKNLSLLVDAYQAFNKQLKKPWPLVLTVSEFSSRPGIVSVGPLKPLEVNVLLSHAAGFFFPSLYEGFGLPPIEAALTGAPLVVSRIPPHEEGLADLSPNEVLWVQPQDIHGWVNAFHKIQRGEIPPVEKLNRQKLLNRFSTERIGVRIDQIYRRVIKEFI
jgi:glycosyltransferase involved in cell wall biosynthesis